MKDPESEEESHFYHDIQTIIRQSGSGYIVSHGKKRKYNRTTDFIDTLVRLGWRREYVDQTFKNMDDHLLVNWNTSILIETMFKEIIRQNGFHDTIKGSLYEIGISEDLAIKLDSILTPLLDSSYTTIQILDNAIEYILGKYDPISLPTCTHLIFPKEKNIWKQYSHLTKIHNIYNIPYSCDTEEGYSLIQTEISILGKNNDKKNDKYSYYYHATSWKSSLQIMDRIDHRVGRKCLDFGINPGFYLTPNIMDAVTWCIKNKEKWGNETCIFLFSVPDSLPEPITIKHLYGKQWTKITKESRECKQELEIREIDDFDFLYGNMVSNPKLVESGKECPKPHRPPKKQLVSRSRISDRFLESHMLGCIYFQKYT